VDNKTRDQKWSDLIDKVRMVRELAAAGSSDPEDLRNLAEAATEADELLTELIEEDERQKDAPGTLYQFPPRPNGPNPTDQGSQ
jgi:hypothetical protein